MKKSLLSFIYFFTLTQFFAQSPERINYQGIARNAAGVPITSALKVRFEIFPSITGGVAAFSEVHNAVPNSFGLFNLEIGSVSSLSSINWAAGPWFLDVSIDPSNGTNFTSIGRQSLVSVPYALYAKEAGNSLAPGDRNGQTLRWDTTLTSGPAWVKDNNLTNDGSHVGIGLYPAGLQSRLHVTTNAATDTSVIFAYHSDIKSKGAGVRSVVTGNVNSSSSLDPFIDAIFGSNHSAINTGSGLAIGNYGFGSSNGTGVGAAGIGYAALPTQTAMGIYATAVGDPAATKFAAVFDEGHVIFNDSIYIIGTNSVNATPGDVLTLSPTGRAKWATPGGITGPFTSNTQYVYLQNPHSSKKFSIGNFITPPPAYGNKFTLTNTSTGDTAMSIFQFIDKPALYIRNSAGNSVALHAKTLAGGTSTAPAIFGEAAGNSTNNAGVYGLSNAFSTGVKGYSGSFNGVWGESNGGIGVLGQSVSGSAGRFLLTSNISSFPSVYIATNANPPALRSESFGNGPAIEAIASGTLGGASNRALLLSNGHFAAAGTNSNSVCSVSNSMGFTFTANKVGNSNDVRGEVFAASTGTLVVNPGNNITIQVFYDKPYTSNAPNVFIQPQNSETGTLSNYIVTSNPGSFTVQFYNPHPSGVSFNDLRFKYFVIE